jgi:hypothetical protein
MVGKLNAVQKLVTPAPTTVGLFQNHWTSFIASGRVIEVVSGHHEQAVACEGSTQVGVPTRLKPSAKG